MEMGRKSGGGSAQADSQTVRGRATGSVAKMLSSSERLAKSHLPPHHPLPHLLTKELIPGLASALQKASPFLQCPF